MDYEGNILQNRFKAGWRPATEFTGLHFNQRNLVKKLQKIKNSPNMATQIQLFSSSLKIMRMLTYHFLCILKAASQLLNCSAVIAAAFKGD